MSSSTTWPPTTRVIGVVDVERLPGKASAKLRCRLHFHCNTSNRHLNRTSASLTARRFLTCCSRSSIRASSNFAVFWLWDIVRYCEHFESVWDVPSCIRDGNFSSTPLLGPIGLHPENGPAQQEKEYSTDVPWLVGRQTVSRTSDTLSCSSHESNLHPKDLKQNVSEEFWHLPCLQHPNQYLYSFQIRCEPTPSSLPLTSPHNVFLNSAKANWTKRACMRCISPSGLPWWDVLL